MLTVLALLALPVVGLLCYLCGKYDGRAEGIAQERARSRKAMGAFCDRTFAAYWRMRVDAGDEVIERLMGRN